MRTRVWMTAVAVCLFSACGGPGGDGEDPVVREARIFPAGVPSIREGGRDVLLVQFGDVPVGTRARRKFSLANRGNGSLLLGSLPDLSPFDSNLSCARGGACADREVPPGLAVEIAFTFAPVYEVEAVRDVELPTNVGPILVRLQGRGASPRFECRTPGGAGGALDFGHVVRGTSLTRKVTCANRSTLDAVLQVVGVSGPNAASFSPAVASAEGKVLVQAGREVEIPVTFVASEVMENFAQLDLQVSGGSRLASILLTGTVLDHALEILPRPEVFDFGFVKPGTSREIRITLRNLISTPLEVRDFSLDPTSEASFSLAPPPPFIIGGFDPDRPGGLNEVQATLRFAPTAVGEQLAQIHVVSGDPADPVLALRVRGFGGGPTVACAPEAVSFGPTASGVARTREVVCTNVTEDEDPGTDADRLRIFEPFTEAPVSDFHVRVKDGIRRDGYGVGESFTLAITYDPSADGEALDRVLLRTNDTAHPTYVIPVDGVGRVLPPCTFEVRPAAGLRFGSVAPRRKVTLEVAVANLQDTACLLQDVSVGRGSDPAFRLGYPGGAPVPYLELPPGGEVRIPVTYAPLHRSSAAEGELRFRVNVPGFDSPDRVVKLRGAAEDSCLVISPPDADLGLVAPACATRTHAFQIVNVCSVPVDVTSIGVPGDQASREFHVTRSPLARGGPGVITLAGAGDAAGFDVVYRPEASGGDIGSVWVQTAQQTEPYLAVLRGEGNAEATQTDRFRQQANPKVDVLWVVSNHDSMGAELKALREHASDFWEVLAASGTDFHLGVTTTGTESEYPWSCTSGGVGGMEDGRLVPVDGSAPRVITPDLNDGLARWLRNLGQVQACQYYEGGVFTSYQALTEPMATSADDPRYAERQDGNAGFLRGDALLSVIYFSDFEDSFPSPLKATSYHWNGMLAARGFDASRLLVHGFVNGKDARCPGAAGVGARYEEMIRAADGHQESICPEDWTLAMRGMAQAALGIRSCFPLTGQPADADGDGSISDRTVPPELEVRLGGQRFDSTGTRGERRWEYGAERNEVCFFPLAVPEPGTAIEMTYGVACLE